MDKLHKCEAMKAVLGGLLLDDALIYYHEGLRPETSRWYLRVHTHYGTTDIPNITHCPFCGEELGKEEKPHG